jgi:hypothetical protein
MGKPPFKASEGGWFDISRKREDATEGEPGQVSGKWVSIRMKVRPEAFPTGSPMSVCGIFSNIKVIPWLKD